MDAPINLASAIKGFLLGLIFGLLVMAALAFIGVESDAVLEFVMIGTLVLALILAGIGAHDEPVEISEGVEKWVGATRSVFNIGFQDMVVPEQTTLRQILIWFLFCMLALVAFVVPIALIFWWYGY